MPSTTSSSSSEYSVLKIKELRNGRFEVVRLIGAGSFGVIVSAKDKTMENQEVAIKLESASTRHPRLVDEIRFMNVLKGGEGIPRLIWSGKEQEHFVMAMELLGPSIADLFHLCLKKFTVKTVVMLAEQLITRLEYIHGKGIVHRDLKPENILMGTADRSKVVFLIDFGLAREYIVHGTTKHIPFSTGEHLIGTMRFASVNAHRGFESSRRDDMESLGYILIYLMRGGKLPWQGLKMKGKTIRDKWKQVKELKMGTSLKDLCKNLPEEMVAYMEYSKSLRFEEKPDYNKLRGFFKKLAKRLNLTIDSVYDWSAFPEDVLKTVMFTEYNNQKRNSEAFSSDTLDRDARRRKAFSL